MKSPPRFFSGMGALDKDRLLLFGGTGNPSGDQEAGKVHYYDLYLINLRENKVKKLWQFSHTGEDFVPVRELIVAADKKSFYTLCYPTHLASSYLRLYQFSLEEGTYEILGDSIPMESKAILSNANLYYNPHTAEYYGTVQEFQEHGGDPSRITLYTLAAPAIPAAHLGIYTHRPSFPVKVTTCILILLLLCTLSFVRYQRKRKSICRPAVAPPDLPEERPSAAVSPAPEKNSIYLFGEFTVYDRQGKEITYMFSNKIRHLFLLLLFKSLDGSGGITSSYMYGILWPDKDTKSAKNLKGVCLNRLRKVLEELDGIQFIHHNGLYTLRLSEEIYCDYQAFLQLSEQIGHGETVHTAPLQQLAAVLRRGKLLRAADPETFDRLKAEQEEKMLRLLSLEISHLYHQQEYTLVSDLAETVLKIDPFHDTALWYLLNSCHKLRKEDKAMKKYYLFAADYSRHLGTEYPRSYAEMLRSAPPEELSGE